MATHLIRNLFKKHPIVKGMVAYSIMWPTGNIIQQTIAGKTWATYDWHKCARFSLYGCLYVAPTLYGWVRLTSMMFPVTTFRTSMMKAAIEQVTYGPVATSSFFFFMSLMESKTIDQSIDEVKQKLWPTMKVGACYWMVIQSINYSLIREKNRVPFVSLFGLIWTTFLAYMKQKENETNQLIKNDDIPAHPRIHKIVS